MPDDFLLFTHWLVILTVGRAVQHGWFLAALIQEELSLLQIPPLSRLACQLNKSHLNFWMPAGTGTSMRTKDPSDIIGYADRHLQQAAFLSCPAISDRRLNEVTGTVKLMLIYQITPAFGLTLKRKIGVQVTIFVLSCGNKLNDCVELLLQLGIGDAGQRPGRGLHPFIDIRVIVK